MKTLKVTINGESWTVHLGSDAYFKEIHGNKIIACCIYNHGKGIRLIHFSPRGTQISTIRHELMHAYLSYHPVTHLSKSEIEELFCDLCGSSLKYIEKMAARIKKAFQ